MIDVAANLASARARIEAAAARAGRDPSAVTLLLAIKEAPDALVAEAIRAGVRDLGENRVAALRARQERFAGEGVRWHMIGTLQSNKAGKVAGRVALIHSIDSDRLARAVGARADGPQEVLLEVNTSGETTKHGVTPAAAAAVAAAVSSVPGIVLRGLMTVAVPGPPEAARACFRTLAALRDEIARTVPSATELSMGMSGDFEAAVEEGATIVRLGTVVLGPRPPAG